MLLCSGCVSTTRALMWKYTSCWVLVILVSSFAAYRPCRYLSASFVVRQRPRRHVCHVYLVRATTRSSFVDRLLCLLWFVYCAIVVFAGRFLSAFVRCRLQRRHVVDNRRGRVTTCSSSFEVAPTRVYFPTIACIASWSSSVKRLCGQVFTDLFVVCREISVAIRHPLLSRSGW